MKAEKPIDVLVTNEEFARLMLDAWRTADQDRHESISKLDNMTTQRDVWRELALVLWHAILSQNQQFAYAIENPANTTIFQETQKFAEIWRILVNEYGPLEELAQYPAAKNQFNDLLAADLGIL